MADKPILEKTFNEELDISERVRQGGVYATLYLEVQANDSEAARNALESSIFKKLKNEKGVDILEVKLYDIQKDENAESFSGVAEITLVTVNFITFVTIIMRYGPTALEIMEPDEILLKTDEIHSLVGAISEMTQAYSSHIMSMLKDEERRSLYRKMLGEDSEGNLQD